MTKRIFRLVTVKHADYQEGYVFNITIDENNIQSLRQIWQTIDIGGEVIQTLIDVDNICEMMSEKNSSDLLISDLPALFEVYKHILDPDQVNEYLEESESYLEDEMMEMLDPRALLKANDKTQKVNYLHDDIVNQMTKK